MPNFKKSTGYKMKGSKFYGAGNQSPLKAVDSVVIDSQKELNKTEDTFRQPGWARVASSLEGMAKPILGRFKDKIMGDGGTKTSSTTSPSSTKKGTELVVDDNIMNNENKLDLKKTDMITGGLGTNV
jgi:hypothetical protein